MRKRNVRAAIAAALCMTVLAAGCGKKADDPVFTGDKTEAPAFCNRKGIFNTIL